MDRLEVVEVIEEEIEAEETGVSEKEKKGKGRCSIPKLNTPFGKKGKDNEEEELAEDEKAVPVLSVPDEIRQYKALMDEGIITEEEFQAKKKQLLNI